MDREHTATVARGQVMVGGLLRPVIAPQPRPPAIELDLFALYSVRPSRTPVGTYIEPNRLASLVPPTTPAADVAVVWCLYIYVYLFMTDRCKVSMPFSSFGPNTHCNLSPVCPGHLAQTTDNSSCFRARISMSVSNQDRGSCSTKTSDHLFASRPFLLKSSLSI